MSVERSFDIAGEQEMVSEAHGGTGQDIQYWNTSQKMRSLASLRGQWELTGSCVVKPPGCLA